MYYVNVWLNKFYVTQVLNIKWNVSGQTISSPIVWWFTELVHDKIILKQFILC